MLLQKKHTDTWIEQTKTKPQETLEFKMKKQLETFSFNPRLNLIEEGKWLLAVTSFEAINSLLNITGEDNSFSISIPRYWRVSNYFEDIVIDKLKTLLKNKSEKEIELNVNEVRRRGNLIKIVEMRNIKYLILILLKKKYLKN